jgi:hypothetical protein
MARGNQKHRQMGRFGREPSLQCEAVRDRHANVGSQAVYLRVRVRMQEGFCGLK